MKSKYFKFPEEFSSRNELLFQEHTQEALERYFVHGLPPGGFVEAVLAGELYRAVAKADPWNKRTLAAIVTWILYNAPSFSYGSYEAVQAWIEDVDGRRTRWVELKEKEIVWDTLKENENA